MAEPRDEEAWAWSCRVNAPLTWRERLAQCLVRLAYRIDGRHYLALRIETQPPLRWAVVQQCLADGIRSVQRDLGVEARAEAEELVFRRAHPTLFQKVPHGQER